MIILDEQLLGYGLQSAIEKWYRGAVTDVTQLRPGTVIKDDMIPTILREASRPTFVTINVADFWRRVVPDSHFAIVCFALTHAQANKISRLLRRLLRSEPFRTKKKRLGKVARVSTRQIQFYTRDSWAVQTMPWP
jgi:hypothetical protein